MAQCLGASRSASHALLVGRRRRRSGCLVRDLHATVVRVIHPRKINAGGARRRGLRGTGPHHPGDVREPRRRDRVVTDADLLAALDYSSRFVDQPGTAGPKVQSVAEMEVFADIWCPFAHAGLQWLFRQRRQLEREDLAIRVRAWPLELVNGAPLDPATTAEHVADLRVEVAADIFTKFDPSHFPKTSLPALSLAVAAYRRDQATGELVSLAVRDALFEEGLDISCRDVLAGVASEYGVEYPNAEDEKTVLTEWHDGEARGVKGSPHFFCGDTNSFCPSLDISKDEDGHLHVRRNITALTQFLTKCLEGPPRGGGRSLNGPVL